MANKPNPFTFFNSTVFMKRNEEFDKRICPAYLLTMYLSHDDSLLRIVNDINHYQFTLPDNIIWKYYVKSVPVLKSSTGRPRSRYIKWIKKVEKTGNENEIEKISKKHNISKREAARILKMQELLNENKH